jgi:hypothetical protein
VRKVLDDSSQQDGKVNEDVQATVASIGKSLQACEAAVKVIHKSIQPLAEETGKLWLRRIKYVWGTPIMQEQKELVLIHLHFLGIDLHILQCLYQRQVMQALSSVVEYRDGLQETAEDRRAEVAQHIEDACAGTAEANEASNRQASDDGEFTSDSAPSAEDVDEDDIVQTRHENYLERDSAPLEIAVRRKDHRKIKKLLEDGLEIAVKDDDDWTLLHHACHNLDNDSVAVLLADPERLPAGWLDMKTRRGETALMRIAQQADRSASIDIARTLLDSGCDANVVQDGSTSRDALYYILDHSKTSKRVRFVRLLVRDNNARIDLVKDAFPQRVKEYPDIRRAMGEKIAEEDDMDDTDEDHVNRLEKRRSTLSAQASEGPDESQPKEGLTKRLSRRISVSVKPGERRKELEVSRTRPRSEERGRASNSEIG